jgi:hypothetical protein
MLAVLSQNLFTKPTRNQKSVICSKPNGDSTQISWQLLPHELDSEETQWLVNKLVLV